MPVSPTRVGVVGPTCARLPTSRADYAELGTVRGSVRYVRQRGILLGGRPNYGEDTGRLVWREARPGTVRNMLRHPICAGAYAYGRFPTDPRRKARAIEDGPLGGRRRLRSLVGPPRYSFLRHQDDHSADARTGDRQAAQGTLAASHETAIRSVQAPVWATMASRDSQLDDQSPARLRPTGATVWEPVPRDSPEGHNA